VPDWPNILAMRSLRSPLLSCWRAAWACGAWLACVPSAQAHDWTGCAIGTQAVPTVLDAQSPGVAFGSQGRITINPQLMAHISPAQQKFIYWHECGHVVLRHVQTTPENESAADCFALRLMRSTGQLSGLELVQLTADMQRLQGDWSHQPGPARVKYLLSQCNPGPTLPAAGP
jgi:Zn-dependent protease with chaperone function